MKLVFLFIISITLMPPILIAGSGSNEEHDFEKNVSFVYDMIKQSHVSSIENRVDVISKYFMSRPYYQGPLGEGLDGRYDQSPLYRADVFDCLTYVETVISLALGANINSFKKNMRNIRYAEGRISFTTRNHFTSIDWNPNNQQQGYVKDITANIVDNNGMPVVKIATAVIDKPAWYKKISKDSIHVNNIDDTEKLKLLNMLRQEGGRFKPQLASVPYIPLSALFDLDGRPDMYLFDQIPNAAIVEIVRPNWDLVDKIGTHLIISHLGFAIRKEGALYFRNASSLEKKVTDELMVEYLNNARNSPTIKGINIQQVLPKSYSKSP